MEMPLEISLGDVIKILVLVGGWLITIVKIDGRLRNVEKDIKEVTTLVRWRERLEEQVKNIRRDVDDLRRGRGFIRESINGEYGREGQEENST